MLNWLFVIAFFFVFTGNDYVSAKRYIEDRREALQSQPQWQIDVPVEYGNIIDRYTPSGGSGKKDQFL